MSEPIRQLRRREAAELLAVSVRTLERLIAAGKIRAVRMGVRCVRIRESELRRYQERREG